MRRSLRIQLVSSEGASSQRTVSSGFSVAQHAAESVRAAAKQLRKRRFAAHDQLRRLVQVRQAVVQRVEIAAVPRGKGETPRDLAVQLLRALDGGKVQNNARGLSLLPVKKLEGRIMVLRVVNEAVV